VAGGGGWLPLGDRTRSLPALTPGAVDAITTAVARKKSPYSMVNWHHFHGAATRIPAQAIAFGLRQEHFMVEIIAGWEPDGSNGAAHRQWAQDLWESLAPFALPGGYANFLTPHDREQARNAYGSNGARLRSSKRRFDPTACSPPPFRCPTSTLMSQERRELVKVPSGETVDD
jgi:hypothetical protein